MRITLLNFNECYLVKMIKATKLCIFTLCRCCNIAGLTWPRHAGAVQQGAGGRLGLLDGAGAQPREGVGRVLSGGGRQGGGRGGGEDDGGRWRTWRSRRRVLRQSGEYLSFRYRTTAAVAGAHAAPHGARHGLIVGVGVSVLFDLRCRS